jgi:hypothetical protein
MTIGIQRSNLEKIQAALAVGNAKIEAVDPDLRPEVKQSRVVSIRQATIAGLDNVLADMAKRQTAAKEGLTYWTQAAARRRAKFADDPALDAAQRMATFETLKRAGTAELLEHLNDAIREKSIARAEAVRLEFHSRPDSAKLGQEFSALFAGVVDPQAKKMEVELGEIAGVAEFAQVLVREFTKGATDPIGRMTAARAAGLVAPPQQLDTSEDRVVNLRPSVAA